MHSGRVPGSSCASSGARTSWLQGAFTALVVTDSDGLVDARTKDLAVANLAGSSGVDDGLLGFFDQSVRQNHLQFGLGNEIHAVLAAAVNLRVPFLPTVASNLEHRHALDANLLQRGFYRFQPGVLNDCFDLGHGVCKSFPAIFTPPRPALTLAIGLSSRRRFPIVSFFAVLREIQSLQFFLL